MRSTPRKRVFFFLSAGWGPVVRTLPIISRLRHHGVASSVATVGPIGPELRRAGFDLIKLDFVPFNAPADEARSWWSPYHSLAYHNVDIDPLLHRVEAHRKAIAQRRPAAVVTDLNPVAALAAKSSRVPHMTISQSLFLPGRKVDSSRWTLPSALPAINKVLAHYGVNPVECTEHLELGNMTVLPSIPEFDPLHHAPPSLEYVGPILGNQLVPLHPSADRHSTANGVPQILLYPGRPYDTAGASGQALLNAAMAALAGIEAAVTVGTGGFDFNIPEYPQDQVQIVPWRVISAEYKPDLIIHHGGHGACLTAISAGIPSVVIPTHAEREYNASHLAALGCGEVVPLEQTDLARLRHAVEGMLDNRVCADRCAQWSQTIATRKYAGADAAARMILAML